MKGKRRWLLAGLLLIVLAITGCGFLRNAEKIATTPEPVVVGSDAEEASEAEKAEQKAEAEEQKLISEIRMQNSLFYGTIQRAKESHNHASMVMANGEAGS